MRMHSNATRALVPMRMHAYLPRASGIGSNPSCQTRVADSLSRPPLAARQVAPFRYRLLPALRAGEADPLDQGVVVDYYYARDEPKFSSEGALSNGTPPHYAWSC